MSDDDFGITFVIKQMRESQRETLEKLAKIDFRNIELNSRIKALEERAQAADKDDKLDKERHKNLRGQIAVNIIWGTLLAVATVGKDIWSKLTGHE